MYLIDFPNQQFHVIHLQASFLDELLEAKRNVASEVVSGGESFLLSMNARAFEAAVSLDAPAQGEVK